MKKPIYCLILLFMIASGVLVYNNTVNTFDERSNIQKGEITAESRIDNNDVKKINMIVEEKDYDEFKKSIQSVQYSEKEEDDKPITWTIKQGDNLWMIADIIYGDGYMYPYLMEINNMQSDTVVIGQVINIKYFGSDEEYNAKSKECYAKIETWTEEAKEKEASIAASGSNKEYVGKFFITGYDAWCKHCCGKTNGITASGKVATVGHTVATSKQFPFGTKLYIEGYGTYVVEDRGVGKGVIDIATSSHKDCGRLTARGVNVYIVK